MSSNVSQKGRRARLSKPDLWYFDRLPPTARQALANAKFSWSAGYYYNKWKRGQMSVQEIARRVAHSDNYVIEKGK